MKTFVFVYGPLMKGERLHSALDDATFIGTGWIRGTLYLPPNADYPALLRDSGRVHGEVYAVSDGLLATLDRIEGTPDLYVRERARVKLANHESLMAETYVYVKDAPEHMAEVGTDWRGYKNSLVMSSAG